MSAFAECERSLIRKRQSEGIALAKQRSSYKSRKKTLTPERAAELVQWAAGGVPKSVLARDYGISRETMYQYLRLAPLRADVCFCRDVLTSLTETACCQPPLYVRVVFGAVAQGMSLSQRASHCPDEAERGDRSQSEVSASALVRMMFSVGGGSWCGRSMT